jgi:hypothetical protein
MGELLFDAGGEASPPIRWKNDKFLILHQTSATDLGKILYQR